jgi:hypothetical protein
MFAPPHPRRSPFIDTPHPRPSLLRPHPHPAAKFAPQSSSFTSPFTFSSLPYLLTHGVLVGSKLINQPQHPTSTSPAHSISTPPALHQLHPNPNPQLSLVHRGQRPGSSPGDSLPSAPSAPSAPLPHPKGCGGGGFFCVRVAESSGTCKTTLPPTLSRTLPGQDGGESGR